MPDDGHPGAASAGVHYDASAAELAELRELIFGGERRQFEELRRRLDTAELTREELAEKLPEAIAHRAARDRQLALALAPTVENAISESVRRNPREIATAIFPVLGPAIRKAIAEAMAGLVNTINRAIEHSLSPRGLRWRLESWRTGVPFAQIVIRHALVYRVEQVFLVHADTGLLLAHACARARGQRRRPHLRHAHRHRRLRGRLVLARARGRRAPPVRRGRADGAGRAGPAGAIAAVVRGEPPDTLLPQLQTRSRRSISSSRARSPTSTATRRRSRRPGRCSRTASRRWSRPTGGRRGAGAAGGFRGRLPRSSWRSCSAGSRCGRGCAGTGLWRGSGPSPASCSPRPSATAAAGASPGCATPSRRIPRCFSPARGWIPAREQRWEPYLSLRPELVLARARRSLSPPAGVKLALSGDTLRATGSAPLDWMASARRIAAVAPGVSALDLTGVASEMPEALTQLKREIEGERVLFAVGSAALGATGRSVATRVAEKLRRLEARATALGTRATLELVGRTDPTGSDAVNQALSRDRAEAVLAALAARGVPRRGTRVNALGTTRPLPGDDPADRARINRSVSFGVSLGPKPGRESSQ